MLRFIPLAMLTAIASASAFAAALPYRLEQIVNPPQIETQISWEPVVETRILPFPTKGPFGDRELTKSEVQKLLQEFDEEQH